MIAGSASVYANARRAGRLAVARRSRRDAATDARSALSAETAVLAQQIIDLDRRHATARTRQAEDGQAFDGRFRDLMADYAELLEAITTADNRGDVDLSALATRIRLLSERCDRVPADNLIRPGRGHTKPIGVECPQTRPPNDSAASSTSTSAPPKQHERDFRQAQGYITPTAQQ
ncbi:hypothetical protein AB0G02_18355 [Actinosynnema sp. NPDC023658]|uniref:hypothetical protein n=1 Tax=Actinosynnema sp. NPDC023658 TaxID=3155465 RepID=UPI0033D530A6